MLRGREPAGSVRQRAVGGAVLPPFLARPAQRQRHRPGARAAAEHACAVQNLVLVVQNVCAWVKVFHQQRDHHMTTLPFLTWVPFPRTIQAC